ncbi:amino acid permease [Macrococcus hajekii]|uniref:Amino acid permease n=1 Tax=Macrococcus hajekii TaxID=198482 RepID=A0A4R6BMY3_9STAP|nr:amino acid permease [Macrococcus hajekii]TDM03098.1 amino acid permease [Macrococcus hajekii]GGB06499.1 gamma-aminobutyrate permease [Macrococcus hajekii]
MEKKEMDRELKTRHISMIAIGGSIGTGLFMASGAIVSQAGPGGALVAYILIGIMIYFLMTSLGELATFYPVSGSFSAYAGRFIDPAAGFTVGWLYWIIWSLVASIDIITAAKVLSYWQIFGGISSFVWCLIFLVLLFLLNAFSVKSFGEAEYWFSFIKVATIIIFLIAGLLMIFGIVGGDPVGLSNFSIKEAPFVNGITGLLGVLVVAGFSFGGTEVVAVTAGESDNPKESMPKAIKQVFWRILFFYIGSIFIIGAILPYTDPRLLNDASDVAMSPFTLVFEKLGVLFAASIMNAVILTAVLSAGNSGLYATSRLLYSLSQEKQAPAFLGRLNKRNMPFNALLLTTVLIILSIIYAHINMGGYAKLLNMLGTLVLIVWVISSISQLRLRRAIKKQNKNVNELLTYKAPLFPLGNIIVIAAIIFLLIGQSYSDIVELNWSKLTESVLPILLAAAAYIIYKLLHHTRIVKLDEMDLSKYHIKD